MPDRFQQLNRKSFIYELKNVPQEIVNWQKANRKLTKIERMISAFLQDCVTLKWASSCKIQQIIKLGSLDKYIMADFFLQGPDVIIEVDGPEHKEKRDAQRDQKIKELFDYTVIRVTNDQVKMQNRDTRTYILRKLSEAAGLTSEQTEERVARYWKLKDKGLV